MAGKPLPTSSDAGVPVDVLRKIAGHGSLTTTRRYLHPDHRAITDAGEDRRVGEARSCAIRSR